VTADVISPRKPSDPAWRSRHAHRSLPADVAGMLTRSRQSLGWTQAQAAAVTGVSRPAICLLELGQRRPSTALALALVTGYCLTGKDAERLLDVALPNVGRSSPYRGGQYVPRF